MSTSANQWAEAHPEALARIRRYTGKPVVVKYGGNAMVSPELRGQVADDLVFLQASGVPVVLVHGGGPEITALLERLGLISHFVQGIRQTDAATLEVVQMVLAGKTNKDLAALIHAHGGRAVGLSGIDGGLLRARKLVQGDVDLGFVGEITAVDCTVLTALMASGFLPVIATLALGEESGGVYNINADTAAAQIAAALGAAAFLQLTNVPGLLRDLADPGSLIREVGRADIPALKAAGIISGGMLPKVDCCLTALEAGVAAAHIIDGRVPHALLAELASDPGQSVGTAFI
jgi:acetylglutamate kinase